MKREEDIVDLPVEVERVGFRYREVRAPGHLRTRVAAEARARARPRSWRLRAAFAAAALVTLAVLVVPTIQRGPGPGPALVDGIGDISLAAASRRLTRQPSGSMPALGALSGLPVLPSSPRLRAVAPGGTPRVPAPGRSSIRPASAYQSIALQEYEHVEFTNRS